MTDLAREVSEQDIFTLNPDRRKKLPKDAVVEMIRICPKSTQIHCALTCRRVRTARLNSRQERRKS